MSIGFTRMLWMDRSHENRLPVTYPHIQRNFQYHYRAKSLFLCRRKITHSGLMTLFNAAERAIIFHVSIGVDKWRRLKKIPGRGKCRKGRRPKAYNTSASAASATIPDLISVNGYIYGNGLAFGFKRVFLGIGSDDFGEARVEINAACRGNIEHSFEQI